MPAKFDRCVKKVKAKGKGKVNPYAVCKASMMRGRRRGQIEIIALLLSNPYVLLGLVGLFLFLFFGGLGSFNWLTTTLFHYDILSGFLSGIARPFALVIFAYIAIILVSGLGSSLTNKKNSIQPVPLVVLLSIMVLAFSYSQGWISFSIGVPAGVLSTSSNFIFAFIGMAIATLGVYLITKKK